MSLTLVIFLIVLGLILMLLEVLVLPGIGVAGIAGAALMIAGVYGAYTIGLSYGHVVLGTTLASSGLLLYLSLRRRTWDRISLSTEIGGKAGINVMEHIKPGDLGESVTRLNPGGKALINGQLWEVTTYTEFIPENSPVEVVKLEVNKIFVKPVKTDK